MYRESIEKNDDSINWMFCPDYSFFSFSFFFYLSMCFLDETNNDVQIIE